MGIDPIVLLAYVSVSINIITMIAACIAYAVFHVRKRRRGKTGGAGAPASRRVTPVFLRRYPMPAAGAALSGAKGAALASSAADPANPVGTR